MFIKESDLQEFIKIRNRLAKYKKYRNEHQFLDNFITSFLEKRQTTNTKNYERIKEKRKTNKNYARKKVED
jgi:hypothetical protein